MNRNRTMFGSVALLAVLFAIGSLMRSPGSQAYGGGSSTPVTVVNAAANPAVTQDVTTNASAMVALTTPLGATIGYNDGIVDLHQILPDSGLSATPYVVPAGYKLVVTEVDILTQSGLLMVNLRFATGLYTVESSESFYVASRGTQQFRFTSGAVYLTGAKVKVEVPATGCSGNVTVHGYLTTI